MKSKFNLHDKVRIEPLGGIPGRVIAIHVSVDTSVQYLVRHVGNNIEISQVYFFEDELV